MIPDGAVEAALEAQLSFVNRRGMDNSANLMRHILEAAAPHLVAAAWDEGHEAGYDNATRTRDVYPAQNPYRKSTSAD